MFTEAAARLALENKINAATYLANFNESLLIISRKDSIINDELIVKNNAIANTKRLHRVVFWKNVELWSYRILIVLGTGYIIGN